MTTIFHKKPLDKESILLFFISGVGFTLPFKININNIFIIGFIAVSLLFFNRLNFIKALKSNKYIFLVWAWSLWNIFSLLWVEDLTQGMKEFNRQLYYFIIPFSFLSVSAYINDKFINTIFKYFIYGCIFTSIICVVNAALKTYDYGSVNPFNEINGNFFSYFNFTGFLKIHPIYFASQVLISLFLIVSDFFNNKILKTFGLVKIGIIIYLVVILMLLNSLIMLFNLIILLIFCFFIFKSTATKVVLSVIIISFAVLSSGFLFEKSKSIKIKSDITQTDFSGNQFTALKARVAKAHGTIAVIKENFWFGVGMGDAEKELVKGYEKIGFQHGVETKYNPHNQYLSEALKSGITGIILFLCVILQQFKLAFNNRNTIQLFFMLSITFFFLTESVLERQMGIVIFIFFTTLFLFMKENKALE
ncbi:MAG: O-antigen ligase family protein [Flavobacteriaceae bacterium]